MVALPTSPARVLIVDDNPDMAKVMGALVRHCGHEVRLANDGASSIDVAREFLPHVAFLDIGLPDMDGYELARRLKSEPGLANTFFVALTGYSAAEDRKRSEQSGFHVHLVKPVTLDVLQNVLDRRSE